ncbi:hypothetical protein [Microcoleus anatoxicus]|uniref:hypothetical protein n=1 Tax=Microcoleus anatoxicus TaxID=2705319 RepID=UPI0030C93DBA
MTQPTPDRQSQPHQSAHAGRDSIQVGGNNVHNSNSPSSTFNLWIPTVIFLGGGMVYLGLVFGRGIGTQLNPPISPPNTPTAPASVSPNP